MRRAFTLLEILVATMLLAMLVTILTMIFNQSSVAWTIGVASLTGMDELRKEDAICTAEADDALLADDGGSLVRVVSVWNEDGSGLRQDGRTITRDITKLSASDMKDTLPDKNFALGSGSAQSRTAYLVGVTSWGPDGQQGTWDDITTMPEEVVK